MRRFFLLLAVLSFVAGCSTGSGSGSGSDSGSTGSSAVRDSSSASSSLSASDSQASGSSKVGKDPLVAEGEHMNVWLERAKTGDVGQRRVAAQVLGVIGVNAPDAAPTIVPVLAKLLADDKPQVRKNAADSLASMAGKGAKMKEAVPALGEALKDKETRDSALKALKDAGPDAGPALPNLVEVLRDRDSNARYSALVIISKLKVEPNDLLPALKIAMGNKDEQTWKLAVKMTVAVGPPAIPELIKWLQVGTEDLNKHAAIALAEFKKDAKPAVPQLIAALNDPDRKFRVRAAEALAAIGDPAAIDPLMDKVSDVDTCGAAANAIVELIKTNPRPDLIEPLIRVLKDGSVGCTEASAKVLAGIGKPAIDPLVELMTVNNNETLEQVAEALGKIGAPARDVLPKLMFLLQDEKSVVSDGARLAIERIGPEDDMIPKLTRVVTNEDGFGRKNACMLLCNPSLRKTGIPKLAVLLESKGSDALSPAAIDDVLSVLMKVDPIMDAKPAVDAIVPLLQHEDEEVQKTARRALKKIDPDTAAKNGIK
jgi:HEAT repeat protein